MENRKKKFMKAVRVLREWKRTSYTPDIDLSIEVLRSAYYIDEEVEGLLSTDYSSKDVIVDKNEYYKEIYRLSTRTLYLKSHKKLFNEFSNSYGGAFNFETEVIPKSNNDIKLNNFITSISFIFPNDYAEALKGDLLEKRNKMVKHKQPRWYIWTVIIVNIGYTFWAAVWFKLKDIMDTDEVKEIDK